MRAIRPNFLTSNSRYLGNSKNEFLIQNPTQSKIHRKLIEVKTFQFHTNVGTCRNYNN
ncbi:hypothetical protein LEP1GSC035_2147 [Leptospira noguchii str. 2007001578]|uniref:Uncharacterized protein n=1 Tax=Leptospira noguchii str. 2007001578 TaxID=1049974 RepID=A0ABN0J6V8_9LEPT|nr:hypothetical protein LEP1GSC035_2147 [Leptospira noguchii str. 2007001578]